MPTRPKDTTRTCATCKQKVSAQLSRTTFVRIRGEAYRLVSHKDPTSNEICWGSGSETDFMPDYSPDY